MTPGPALFPPPGSVDLVGRTAIEDAAYQLLTTDKLVGYTSLTATRTATLPAGNAVAAGQVQRVADESGSCRPWRAIRVAPAGSDTINGVASYLPLVWPYESVALEANGVNRWTVLGRSHPRAAYLEVEPRGAFLIDDDCFGTTSAFTSTAPVTPYVKAIIGSGGGGGQCQISTSLTGVLELLTAASGSANDRAYLYTLGTNTLASGSGLQFCEFAGGLYTLPDGTNDFVVVLGFIDAITNARSVDGAWWEINRSVSANWLCVTSNNSSRTVEDSGIPWAVADYSLAVEIAADGSAAYFFNGTTLAETIATNIPAGAGRAYGVGCGFYKTAGTASGLEIIALDRVRAFVRSTSLRAT